MGGGPRRGGAGPPPPPRARAAHGWSLDWTFPGDQRVTQMWNAEHTRSGTTVTAKNVDWNAGVAPGASVSFGFTGSWSGTNAEPSSFALGDRVCGRT
ncbi:cellulose binding domain-containing protein [Streptomyces sp. NPDC059409]|uniref:cellulose binding domain-containing protein n=1 Tax=Streptomyces sp. NPDC059409 TaxID=3346824 RepID=UPI0036BA3DB5